MDELGWDLRFFSPRMCACVLVCLLSHSSSLGTYIVKQFLNSVHTFDSKKEESGRFIVVVAGA